MKSHRVGASLVFAVLVSALAVALAGPVLASDPPGNNGTVKIHEGPNEPSPEVRNQPHVCDFHLHFFFGDANQSGSWEIQRWAPGPKGQVVRSGTYNDTDGDGEDREPNSGVVARLPDGHYKLFWDGDTGKHDKHKVFWVKCAQAPTQPTPTPTPPTQATPTPPTQATPTPPTQATPTPTPVGGATPTPTPAGGAATPTPTPAGNVGGATPTPAGTVAGATATPEPTLPPTNTLESPDQPVGNIPVVLLVLVAIGSIVIGATVLRPRPVRTRR